MRKIVIIMLCALVLNISACGVKEENAEVQQETVTTETEVVQEQTEEVSEEVIEEVVEEEIIEVNIENVTITPQENWELLSYDEAANKVVYQIESEGQKNEVSIYTIPDFALKGAEVNNNVISNTYIGLAQKFFCHDYYFIAMGNTENGYVNIAFMLEDHTKQISCVTGDYGTLVMEAPAYIVNDEVAQNIKYAYDSNDAGKTASFVSMELYNKCEIKGTVDYYEKEQEAVVQENTQNNQKQDPVRTEEDKKVPVADTSHYMTLAEAQELGIPVDFTDKTTVITDGNPNYTILRNGPGPIVKTSYPYIGKDYIDVSSGEMLYEGWKPAHVMIHSTDYYGAPIHITIMDEDIIFNDSIWCSFDVIGQNGVEIVEWTLLAEDGQEARFCYNYSLDTITLELLNPIRYNSNFHFSDNSIQPW